MQSMSWAIVALSLVAALAGCGGKTVETQDTVSDVNVSATATTGVIKGIVLDDAVRPLAGVAISVRAGPKTLYANTTGTGGFGFEGLQPGAYFVKAHKLGYFDIQAAADVVAGVSDPKPVKITMPTDTSFRKPYVQPQQVEGYVECTTSFVAVCGAVNFVGAFPCVLGAPCVQNATNDRFGLYIYYDPNATMIQSEMRWDSSQALSVELTLEMENTGGCDAPGDTYVADVSGPSPIYNKLDQKDVESVPFGGSCPIFHSVFSGDTQGTPVGFTASQPFTIYSHSFYGFLPPDGWRFTVDGTPEPPQ